MDPTYMFQPLHSCGYLQDGALKMYYKSLEINALVNGFVRHMRLMVYLPKAGHKNGRSV
jgi:hypothetical protein